MNHRWNRRDLLKGLLAASAAVLAQPTRSEIQEDKSAPSGQVEVQIGLVSSHTFRLSVLPLTNIGAVERIPYDGSLVQESWGAPSAKLRADASHTVTAGSNRVEISLRPVRITATNERGEVIQQFRWDEKTGALTFLIGNSPLFGLWEGGPQFDATKFARPASGHSPSAYVSVPPGHSAAPPQRP